MFYLPGATNNWPQSLQVGKQDTFTESVQKRKEANSHSPNRLSLDADDKGAAGKTPAAIASSNPDVNEYIVKIEMKKF